MPNHTTLTAAEFRSAIYLDFEGRKSIAGEKYPMPHMAGVFNPNLKGTGGKYSSNFFKSDWKPAANGAGREVSNNNFQDFFAAMIEVLVGEDRYLVYWTVHEEVMLERHLTRNLWQRVKPYLFNLHPLARRYMNRRRGFGADKTARGRLLEEFLAAMYKKRQPYPPLPLGPSIVCQRIAAACARTKRWGNFTDVQKKYVKDLLAYNEGDCRSTWLIAKRVGNFYASDN